MQQRHLGSDGPRVSAISLGRMGMSGISGAAGDKESVAAIQAALDAAQMALLNG